MATHTSILAWKIPWTEESGGLQSTGSQRVRHNRVTFTFTFPNKHLLYGNFCCLILGDLPGVPVVNNSCNSGDVGTILGQEIKIPHVMGQLGPCATTREPVCHN